MGRGQKHAEGVVEFFFFIPATNYDADLDRKGLFSIVKKGRVKAKSAKNVVIFGEKSPKISDRHINNRLYNYEKVQNLMSFSIITERFI